MHWRQVLAHATCHADCVSRAQGLAWASPIVIAVGMRPPGSKVYAQSSSDCPPGYTSTAQERSRVDMCHSLRARGHSAQARLAARQRSRFHGNGVTHMGPDENNQASRWIEIPCSLALPKRELSRGQAVKQQTTESVRAVDYSCLGSARPHPWEATCHSSLVRDPCRATVRTCCRNISSQPTSILMAMTTMFTKMRGTALQRYMSLYRGWILEGAPRDHLRQL